jgi:hypothetical protein
MVRVLAIAWVLLEAAKFAEEPFHALGCTRDRRGALATFPTKHGNGKTGTP